MKTKIVIAALLIMSLATGSNMKSSLDENSTNYDRTVYVHAYMSIYPMKTVLVSDVYAINDRDQLGAYGEAMEKLRIKLFEHAIDDLKLEGKLDMVGANYEFNDRSKLEKRREELIREAKNDGDKILYPDITFTFSYDYRKD